MTQKINETSKHSLMTAAFLGGFRGVSVELCVFPVERIKIQLQSTKNSVDVFACIREIFYNKGVLGFYQGLQPSLIKSLMRQVWCWPMLSELPKHCQAYGYSSTKSQALTGLFVTCLDVSLTAPFERMKILLASGSNPTASLNSIHKNGWNGFALFFSKRLVAVVSFLIVQDHLRNQAQRCRGDLSLSEMTKIGIITALFVGIVSAPFDFAYTYKQIQNKALEYGVFQKNFKKIYKGAALSSYAYMIHCIASVILLEKLEKFSASIV